MDHPGVGLLRVMSHGRWSFGKVFRFSLDYLHFFLEGVVRGVHISLKFASEDLMDHSGKGNCCKSCLLVAGPLRLVYVFVCVIM